MVVAIVSLALAIASRELSVHNNNTEATTNTDHNLTLCLNIKLEAIMEQATAAIVPPNQLLKLNLKLLSTRPHLHQSLLWKPAKATVVSAKHALLVLLKTITKPEDLAAAAEDGELPELPGLRLEWAVAVPTAVDMVDVPATDPASTLEATTTTATCTNREVLMLAPVWLVWIRLEVMALMLFKKKFRVVSTRVWIEEADIETKTTIFRLIY